MVARLVVLVAAVGAGAFGMIRGTWAVGGSDSSCYALMADAFARGTLQPAAALAADAPWPDASRTFAPGGFIPSPVRRDAASPICSPGFALLLAPFRLAFGADGIFLLTPLAGALLVWASFALGREIAGQLVGAASAVITATAPVFLFQVAQPMNDVVTSALWTGAIAVLARDRYAGARRSSANGLVASAGVLTGLAILVRPNLAPAAVPVLCWLWWDRGTWQAPVVLAAAATPFVAVTAALNWLLYGLPLGSGYGAPVDLFALAHVPANVVNYGATLLSTQLAFPLLGFAAPAVLPQARQRVAFLIVAVTVVVTAIYLLYTPFPEWWYLRFLLPVLPMMTVLACATLAAFGRGPWLVIAATAAVAIFSTASSATTQALDLARLEHRFRMTGAIVRERLPANAVVISVWDSGSVRYHAGREAVLWDSLDPRWLDRAIAWLISRGRDPYLVLEEWEEPSFRQRFAAFSPLGNIDWPPRFDVARRVRIFSPADRSRYLAGDAVPTEIIRDDRR